jgi:hypothetical protein
MGPSHYHVMLDVLRPKDRARRQNNCWTDHAGTGRGTDSLVPAGRRAVAALAAFLNRLQARSRWAPPMSTESTNEAGRSPEGSGKVAFLR